MYRVQVESIMDVVPEIMPLMRTHWEETVIQKDQLWFTPNFAWLYESELEGDSILLTVRAGEDGSLVGYHLIYMWVHPHYRVLHAASDMLYLDKEHHGTGAGKALLIESERVLEKAGVKLYSLPLKISSNPPDLTKHGYYVDEIPYLKFLGDSK